MKICKNCIHFEYCGYVSHQQIACASYAEAPVQRKACKSNTCRKLFCRLTGGHKYKAETLVTYHCRITKEVWFGNFCAKCGTFKQWTIPAEAILGELRADT